MRIKSISVLLGCSVIISNTLISCSNSNSNNNENEQELVSLTGRRSREDEVNELPANHRRRLNEESLRTANINGLEPSQASINESFTSQFLLSSSQNSNNTTHPQDQAQPNRRGMLRRQNAYDVNIHTYSSVHQLQPQSSRVRPRFQRQHVRWDHLNHDQLMSDLNEIPDNHRRISNDRESDNSNLDGRQTSQTSNQSSSSTQYILSPFSLISHSAPGPQAQFHSHIDLDGLEFTSDLRFLLNPTSRPFIDNSRLFTGNNVPLESSQNLNQTRTFETSSTRIFDTSETELLPFLLAASSPIFPSFADSPVFDYVDPETDETRYFQLPISSEYFGHLYTGEMVGMNDSACNASATQHVSNMDYHATCSAAEIKFDNFADLITEVPQLHLNYSFENIVYISRNSTPLSSKHLKAFELNFPAFYQLVRACPHKYFLSALTVSLQYDQDFYKFLELWFGIKDFVGHEFKLLSQKIIINLLLNMPRVSNAAFNFFSSSKNAIIFFASIETYPIYCGKFSPDIVAKAVSGILTKSFDNFTFENPMRSWLLSFNYFNFINENYNNSKFFEANMMPLLSTRNLFRTDTEYNACLYTMAQNEFKRDDLMEVLFKNGKIRILLNEALKRENFDFVKTLFMKFTFELHEISIRRNRFYLDESSFDIKKLNDSFSRVKISGGLNNISMIIPIDNKLV